MKETDANEAIGWTLRILAGAALLCIAVFIGRNYRTWLTASSTFQVREIEINGNEVLTDAEVLKLASLESGQSMWRLNLRKTERAIARSPYVDRARVFRLFPDGVEIRVAEKEALALLESGGRMLCIDERGSLFPSRPGKLYDLPILSGISVRESRTGSVPKDSTLLSRLRLVALMRSDRPGLYTRISEIACSGKDGMVFFTSRHGIKVFFGEGDAHYKIRCLDAVLREMEEKKQGGRVAYIDLRYRNQVILGMRT
ncbi:FtsQ-type POTRA domain-containing protein [bacterium]|nr:FtsQ-type POTRA domain-containing protein [bacterium]